MDRFDELTRRFGTGFTHDDDLLGGAEGPLIGRQKLSSGLGMIGDLRQKGLEDSIGGFGGHTPDTVNGDRHDRLGRWN